jgi:integrase
MGLYRRTKKRKDGAVRKSRVWWMNYMLAGEQQCESTKTTNKRRAQKILDLRVAEIIEGRFRLPRSNAPTFKPFGQDFLNSIRHENTKKRYTSSVVNLLAHFRDVRLSEIYSQRIEDYKDVRLAAGTRAATVNRDLAVLRRMLNIAEKKQFITSNPFREVEMLEERKERRQPHILTYAEEEMLLSVAEGLIRILAILILDTGLRSGREALALKWQDVDFANKAIRIKQSKTFAGIRSVPMSTRCASELMRWREQLGPEFSQYVFANPKRPQIHLGDVRRAWPKALKAAGIEFFWLYDLRHTFASRLTEAGVSPIFVAQIMGHANPNILQTYAKANDEYRRAAICSLEAHREAQCEKLKSQHLQMIQ